MSIENYNTDEIEEIKLEQSESNDQNNLDNVQQQQYYELQLKQQVSNDQQTKQQNENVNELNIIVQEQQQIKIKAENEQINQKEEIQSKRKSLKKLSPNLNQQSNEIIKQENKEENQKQQMQEYEQYNMQRIKETNVKLKQELQEVYLAFQGIVEKEQQKKQNVEQKSKVDIDPILQESLNQLDLSQKQVSGLKLKIQKLYKMMEQSYDLNKVIQVENGIKDLERQIKEEFDQKNSILKIQSNQKKVLSELKNNDIFKPNLEQANDMLKKIKEENRIIAEQLQENERIVRSYHEHIISRMKKIKEIEKKIIQRKKDIMQAKVKLKDEPEINDELIKSFTDKYNQLIQDKNNLEKEFIQKIKLLDQNKQVVSKELNQKIVLLKEKEKEQKFYVLKIKEMAKYVRHTQVEPLSQEVNSRHGSSQGKQKIDSIAHNTSSTIRNADINVFHPNINQIHQLSQQNQIDMYDNNNVDSNLN